MDLGKFPILWAIVMMCSACANIETNLSVLKPSEIEKAKSSALLRSELYAAYTQDKKDIIGNYEEKFKKSDELYDELSESFESALKKETEGSVKQKSYKALAMEWAVQKNGIPGSMP